MEQEPLELKAGSVYSSGFCIFLYQSHDDALKAGSGSSGVYPAVCAATSATNNAVIRISEYLGSKIGHTSPTFRLWLPQ